MSEVPPLAPPTFACAAGFKQLAQLLSQVEEDWGGEGITYSKCVDQHGRFKIWAGNLGAFQSGSSSLSFRLRDAPNLRNQVSRLLRDLKETLMDVYSIISGNKQNRTSSITENEEYLSPSEGDEEFKSELELEIVNLDDSPKSEARERFLFASDIITHLFQLSVIIKNSTPRDRYSRATAAVTHPFNDQYDIAHVGQKFPKLERNGNGWLKCRLGKAITLRRQYFRYCREHHDRLSSLPAPRREPQGYLSPEPDQQSLTPDQRQAPEIRSRITESISHTTYTQTAASTLIPGNIENVDIFEDTRSQISQVSSVSQISDSHATRVLPLSKVKQDGLEFLCPYCWEVRRDVKENKWKKHVFKDIRPFVCTFENCGLKLFPGRRAWFEHELQTHRREWRCNLCAHKPNVTEYQSLNIFKDHIRTRHASQIEEDLLSVFCQACYYLPLRIPAIDCPFCDEWEQCLRKVNPDIPDSSLMVVTPEQFRDHVGNHMVELAVFALPRPFEEEYDDAASNAAVLDNETKNSFKISDTENENLAMLESIIADDPDAPVDEIRLEDGKTLLAFSAMEGHASVVEFLLNKCNVHLDMTDKHGVTPLLYAVQYGYERIVSALLEKGADVDAEDISGNTPLLEAVVCGHDRIVSVLLEKGADADGKDISGNTPLLHAAIHGHDHIVSALLEKGADADAKDICGNTSLLEAVVCGHDRIVSVLLEKGANVNAKNEYGDTPLIFSSRNGQASIVSRLVQAKGVRINHQNIYGRTALSAAAECGHLQIVRSLLSAGANPNSAAYSQAPITDAAGNETQNVTDMDGKDFDMINLHGRTPLSFAAEKGHMDVVKLLLKNKADPNKSRHPGRKPVSWAAKNGHINMTNYLFAISSYPHPEDGQGVTPMSWARDNGCEDAMNFLVENGADPESWDAYRGVELPSVSMTNLEMRPHKPGDAEGDGEHNDPRRRKHDGASLTVVKRRVMDRFFEGY